MSLKKEVLSSEDKVLKSLAKSIAQEALTPVLEAATVTVLVPRHDALSDAVIERNSAITAEGILVKAKNVAGVNLKAECSGYFAEINTNCKKKVGGNDKSIRTLFGMPQKTGKQPVMITENDIILAAKKVKDGDAVMVTDGYVLNVGTTAASVLILRNIYAGLLDDVSTAQTLINDKELLVQAAFPLALETANDIPRQIGNFYRAMTAAQIRVKKGLFGSAFAPSKVLTPIKVVVKGPLPDSGAGASVRIGDLLTKKKKPSKEGVKGTTDSDSMIILETTKVGLTYVIVKKINCADAEVPITIVAGTPQRIEVTLVAGVSSLT